MRGGGFEKMADVVEFVTAGEPRPARRAGHARHFLRREQPARRVEIAVRLLRGGDLGNEIVEILVELRVGRDRERVSRALDDLIDIAVVERDALEPALHQSGGLGEVVNAPGLLAALEVVPNRDGAVGLHARRPERVLHMHGRKRHRLDRVVLRRRCGAGDEAEDGDKNDGGGDSFHDASVAHSATNSNPKFAQRESKTCAL